MHPTHTNSYITRQPRSTSQPPRVSLSLARSLFRSRSLYLFSPPGRAYPRTSRSFICLSSSRILSAAFNPFHILRRGRSYRDRISSSNFPFVRAESQSNNHLRALHSYLTRRESRFYTALPLPSSALRFFPPTRSWMAMPLDSVACKRT